MSDNDLATRAPESDLAEQSAIRGDTVVDQGASLGVSLLQKAWLEIVANQSCHTGALPDRPTFSFRCKSHRRDHEVRRH